jgi:hypothetical protein
MGDFHRCVKARRGDSCAPGHKIAVIFYSFLENEVEYG